MSTYDVATRVSNAQSLVGIATPTPSESSIRLISMGATTRLLGLDVASGAPIKFRMRIATSFDAGTVSMVVGVIYSSTADLLGTPYLETMRTLTVANAELVAGYEHDIVLPMIPPAVSGPLLEYVGLFYWPTVAPSTGAVTAFVPLGENANTPRRYPGNFTGPYTG